MAAEEEQKAAAKGQSPFPNLLPPIQNAVTGVTTDINQIVSGLQKIAQADLTSAIAVAKAGGDTVGENGFQALANLISSMQAADATNTSGVEPVTAFAKVRLVAIALRQGSAFSTAFAPLAQEVKMDVLNAAAALAGGTITLASFGL